MLCKFSRYKENLKITFWLAVAQLLGFIYQQYWSLLGNKPFPKLIEYWKSHFYNFICEGLLQCSSPKELFPWGYTLIKKETTVEAF